VLRRWLEIANADVNELVQLRRCACRHCHGIDHEYQWTEFEFRKACEEHDKKRQKAEARGREFDADPPDDRGGFGFDPEREPDPDCPVCFGKGEEVVHIEDTRYLRGPAKHLYGGVKQTKYGVEVQIYDKMDALNQIARHLGMFGKDSPLFQQNNQFNIDNRQITAIRRIIVDPKAEGQDEQ
jgi:phage terminase small subunit